MKYIIEHLEPKLYKWCLMEYTHISGFVGKKDLIFTNVKSPKAQEKLKSLGQVYKESVSELKLQKICVLDPESKNILSPKDKFEYMIFGGILGDYPPRKRTKEELTKRIKKPFETRNLGDKQMPTNVAVYSAKKIIEGTPFEKLRFADELEIQIKEGESVMLPFRYIIENNKPVLPKNFIEFMIKRKGF